MQKPQVHQFQSLRVKLEEGGPQAADQLLEEYSALQMAVEKNPSAVGCCCLSFFFSLSLSLSLSFSLPKSASLRQARAKDRMLANANVKQEEERSTPVVVDSDTMAKLMNQAQKLRKDGYIEWHEGAKGLQVLWCDFADDAQMGFSCHLVSCKVPSRKPFVAGAKQKLICTEKGYPKEMQDRYRMISACLDCMRSPWKQSFACKEIQWSTVCTAFCSRT